MSAPAFCEKYVLQNIGQESVAVEIPTARSVIQTDAEKGVEGSYRLVATLAGQTACRLQPGESVSFSVTFAGYKPSETEQQYDIEQELRERQAFLAEVKGNLVLETPDSIVNTMFAFAKIRATESIYDTKGGLMHGPGGVGTEDLLCRDTLNTTGL